MASKTIAQERRYDIDWLRTIAIFLLIIYHSAITFQPWGLKVWFIQSEQSLEALWIPMSLLNIWRIPLLFFISGIGIFFAMNRRDWKQLIVERAKRLIIPYIFGLFAIVPLYILLLQSYYSWDLLYTPNAGHLWYLNNIHLYGVALTPLLFFMKKRMKLGSFTALRGLLDRRPVSVYLLALPLMLEAAFVHRGAYASYANTLHGYVLGLIVFFLGFFCMILGDSFRRAITSMKWVCLLIATILFVLRLLQLTSQGVFIAIESISWIFAVMGLAERFLNRPSKLLSYLSVAVYPVYIIHMVMQYLSTYFILRLDIAPLVQFLLVVVCTLVGSFLFYEIIRRIFFLRVLFGLKMKNKKVDQSPGSKSAS